MRTPEVDLRWAVATDRAALGELHRRSSFVWPEDRDDLEAHPEVFGVAAEAIDERRVRIATGGDASLLGFSVVAGAGAGVLELDDLFVDPPMMRMGIGRTLLEDAAARAWMSGYARMTVIAHRRTFAFYERVGFVLVGPAQTRFGPASRLALDRPDAAGD